MQANQLGDSQTCWQYQIRVKNLQQDLLNANLTLEDTQALTCSDFEFRAVISKQEQVQIRQFIERHEWLGNLSQYTTHWFAAYYKHHMAGAVLMNVPNAFSKLLGEDTQKLERLISRGACVSWSPKNLGSYLIMWAIKWMVRHTDYRLFTAYSDPLANELGTIYQACNFYYLGNKFGTTTRYINPYTGKLVSDRFFRQKTAYRKYARELNLKWQSHWMKPTGMNWEAVPEDVAVKLRTHAKQKQQQSERVIMPAKHKYAYVLGSNKSETKHLRRIFLRLNKVHAYPKQRGE